MDVRKLRKIVELLSEFDIADFKLKDEQSTVHITRKYPLHAKFTQESSASEGVEGDHSANTHSRDPHEASPTFANRDQKNLSLDGRDSAGPYADGKVIKSPMVGTFYSAASPDSDPFVRKGKKIQVGDMICIIEAMKIMNRIESDVSGVVKEVLVENGEPVQFGQILVVLE